MKADLIKKSIMVCFLFINLLLGFILAGCTCQSDKKESLFPEGETSGEEILSRDKNFSCQYVRGKILFGSEASRPLLLSGWSKDEKTDDYSFVWAADKEASLLLPLRKEKNFLVILKASPFLSQTKEPQNVKIFLNGTPIHLLTMNKGWHEYAFSLPNSEIIDGNNELSLQFHYLHTAETANGPRDSRKLAASFQWLEFYPIHEKELFWHENRKFPLPIIGSNFLNQKKQIILPPSASFSFSAVIPLNASLFLEYEHSSTESSISMAKLLFTFFDLRLPDTNHPRELSYKHLDSPNQLSLELSAQAGIPGIITIENCSPHMMEQLSFNSIRLEGNVAKFDLSTLKTRVQKNMEKVCLIGVDGMTWDILLELHNKGKVTHFSQLINNGFCAPLQSLLPSKSPALWTTIATGKTPEKHGIDDFIRWNPEHTIRVPLTADFRTSKFLWNILSELDKSVSIVGWWPSWPAEPVNGFLVSNQRGEKRKDRETFPPALLQEIEQFQDVPPFPSYDFFSSEYDPVTAKIGDYQLLDYEQEFVEKQLLRAYRRDNYFVSTAAYLSGKQDFTLTATYLNGVDPVSHLFWKYSYPERFNLNEAQIAALGNVIQNMYIHTDQLLGKLLKTVPPDTNVVLVSDHGFGENPLREFSIDTNLLLAHAGLLKFKAKSRDVDESFSIIQKGPGYSTDIRQKLSFVNREDRTATNRKDLLERISKKLMLLRTSEGNTFIDVIDESGDNYDCAIEFQYAVCLDKDIVIGKKRFPFSYFFKEKRVSGVHSHGPDGVLVMSGPLFRQTPLPVNTARYRSSYNAIAKPVLMDITPTILFALGAPIAGDMDGRVIIEAFRKNRIKDHSVLLIDTYEDFSTQLSNVKEVKPEFTEQDEAYEAQLKMLGYLEGESQ